jgi:hypothetical protein
MSNSRQEGEEKKGLNGWKTPLIAILGSLLISGVGHFFTSYQNRATDSDLRELKLERQQALQQVADKMELALTVLNNKIDAANTKIDNYRIIQAERTTSVQQVPNLVAAISEIKGEVNLLKQGIEGLRRNMRDFRDVIYEKTGTKLTPQD